MSNDKLFSRSLSQNTERTRLFFIATEFEQGRNDLNLSSTLPLPHCRVESDPYTSCRRPMPQRSLFPVELPALTFDSRSLTLIKWSTAAERLFRRKFTETKSISAADLVLPPSSRDVSGEGETRIDKLRERLARSVAESERLPWGECLTMEYYPQPGQESQAEKADVLVSLRQIDGFTSFTILFLRPGDNQARLSPSPHLDSETTTITKSFVDQLLSSNGKGKGGGEDSNSTASVRSSSFSSADKRYRPTVGKEREKLPLSAETAHLLSHAVSRVQASNSSNPPTPVLSASIPSLEKPPLESNISASTPSLEKPSLESTVFENMHQLFTNSPVYEGVASKSANGMEVDKSEAVGESEQPEPVANAPSRYPLSLEELTELVETQPQVACSPLFICFFANLPR